MPAVRRHLLERGADRVAYETKVILSLLAERIVAAETLEEAYMVIVEAANVEGIKLPDYGEAKKKLEQKRRK